MNSKFNPWPYGVIAFFVLLLCGIATVLAIALTHRETMVSANYYEQELKYQDRIDSTARAQQCGAEVRLDGTDRKLVVRVPAEQVAQKLSGAIEFYRPSAPELDCQFALAPDARGAQSVDVSQLRRGLWQVRVGWNAGGQNYFLEEKITL
jgi:hypothetical protein